MNRAHLNAVSIVVMMLAVGLTPVVSADSHTSGGVPGRDDDDVPEPPRQSPVDWNVDNVTTEIQPVDRNVEPVIRAVNDANGTFADAYYRIIGERLNDADERIRDIQQPLTLFRDGAGGRSAQEWIDLLDGGFGESQVMGTHAWEQRGGAASQGQVGYQTPANADGTYPPFAQSLLVTPELDLRTNQFMEGRLIHDSNRESGATQEEGVALFGDLLRNEACPNWKPGIVTELDGAVAQLCSSQLAGSGPIGLRPDVPSTVYENIYWGCDAWGFSTVFALALVIAVASLGALIAVSGLLIQTYLTFIEPHCLAYKDLVEQEDTYATLHYDIRYNLASGRDGVVAMVFTEPPTVAAAQQCFAAPAYRIALPLWAADPPTSGGSYSPGYHYETPCRVVLPQSGDYRPNNNEPVTGLDHPLPPGRNGPGQNQQVSSQPSMGGYTGYSDWIRDSVDLTPWSGQSSVWVGFYFTSDVFSGSQYFDDPSRFNTDAGFYGAQLDSLELQSPAAYVNVGVRPLVSPTCATDACPDGVPVLDPSDPSRIVAHVTNYATKESNVNVTVRILHAADRTEAHALPPIEETLASGAHLELTMDTPDLPFGSYIVQVCAARIADEGDRFDSDPGFCDGVKSPEACTEDQLEAAPCDQVVEQRFDFFPLLSLQWDPPQVLSDSLNVGDTTQASLTLRNTGNQDETVRLQAFHVDLETGDRGQNLLSEEDRQPRMVTVPAGHNMQTTWSLGGSQVGNYRFMVQMNNSAAEPPRFEAEHDLLPRLIQPWRPQFVQDGVTVDGVLNDTIWAQSPRIPLDDGIQNTRIQVGNNATHLVIGLLNLPATDPNLPALDSTALFINDMDDGDLASGGGGFGFLRNASGVSVIRFDAAHGTWSTSASESWAWDDAPIGSAMQVLNTTNPDNDQVVNVEIRIPIGGSSPDGLKAGPGDALGLLLRHCDSLAPFRPCFDHPPAAPLYDGDGFLPPDGDLADELLQWRTILLAEETSADVGAGSPLSANPLSNPFSVGIGSAPPIYREDFRECPTFTGWEQIAPLTAILPDAAAIVPDAKQQWNCAHYPEDGRPLLYWGASPGSTCGTDECLPYAGLSDAPTPTTDENTFLWTPPIEIPTDAQDLNVLLAHQYSTDVDIEDRGGGRIRVNHVYTASVEVWNETLGVWEGRGALMPEDGHPTEESTGIRDTRFPSRQFYVDPGCPAAGGNIGFCSFADAPSPPSWWWPQGDQPTYRPLDRDVPVPGDHTFHGGSPWQLDRLPLQVTDDDGSPVDLRGEMIRLRFDATTKNSANRATDHTPQPDLEDWGWRIAELAVVEGSTVQRDLTVRSVTLDTAYDPLEQGVGPGTTLPVQVVVHNAGQLQAKQVRVHVAAEDPSLSSDHPDHVHCTATGQITGVLLPDTTRNITVECPLHKDRAAGQVAVRAWVQRTDGVEEITGNDQQRVRGHFTIRENIDASIAGLDVTPRSGTTGEGRRIPIWIQNGGNVPLHDVTVTLRIFDINDPSRPPIEVDRREWSPNDPLPVQKDPVRARDFLDLSDSIRFTPNKPGQYVAKVSLDAPGLQPTDRTLAVARFEATDELYRLDFDRAPQQERNVINGTTRNLDPQVWSIQPTGGVDGSARLMAGDPTTGEIPPGSDASFLLPPVDLGLVQGATLTFKHKYDLEKGFDAARPEISLDGGDTWMPLQPRSDEAAGLPEGFPSEALIGVNDILGDQVECHACAYTGKSSDLSDDPSPWKTAEFDLSRQPALWIDAPIDAFPLEGFAPHAMPFALGTTDQPQFFHDTWLLDEPNAAKFQRYWWIDNRTYSEPLPLSGGTMWWSGYAERSQKTGETPPVDTQIRFEATVDAEWSLGPEERLVLSFWDWRAGWQDSADTGRLGTGGKYLVDVLTEPSGMDGQPTIEVVERLPSGWTRREVDLTPLFEAGQTRFEAGYEFISGTATHAPRSDPDSDLGWAADVEENRGWFIDRVTIHKEGPDGSTPLFSNEADDAGGVQSIMVLEGDVAWSPIVVGGAARDGGWHVADASVPGKGESPVWRFAENNLQGYPNGADSRLVTPVMDLRKYRGDSAALTFAQKYQFHGTQHSGNVPGRAIDAGAVEFQVLDESTGTFGPWQTLSSSRETPELAFSATPPRLERNVFHQASWSTKGPLHNDPSARSFAFAQSPEHAPFDPTVRPNDIRLTVSEYGPAGDRVGGDRDLGASFDTGLGAQTAGGSTQYGWALRWQDRDGNGRFDDGDDAYIGRLTFSGGDITNSLIRLMPVEYPGFSAPAGTYVDPCSAGSGDPDSCNGGSFEQGRGGQAAALIQWADLDGDGNWSYGDAAYIPATAFNPTDDPAAVVGVGDVRLTPLGSDHTPTQVSPGDPDLGAALQPGGRFVICKAGGEVYATTAADADCGRGSSPTFQGLGSTFPTSPGWVANSGIFGDMQLQFAPLEPYPYTPVFSGDSGGWQDWNADVSDLIGEQVRFGFHVWTNPSEEPCGDGPPSWYVPTTSPCKGLHGWSIADVTLEGQKFQGVPAIIRFRVATDDSMPKGEWSIDDIRVSGIKHQKGVTITADQTRYLEEPGETMDLDVDVRNVGGVLRDGLLLAIDARDADGAPFQEFQVTPAGASNIPDDQLPPGTAHVVGPFSLAPGGGGADTLPATLRMDGVPEGRITFTFTVLEHVESCATVDGETTCEESYREVQNDRSVGRGAISIDVVGEVITDLELVPPVEGRPATIIAEPSASQYVEGQWQPVELRAALLNNGTAFPDGTQAVWTVTEIIRKGHESQEGTLPKEGATTKESHAIDPIGRGSMASLTSMFTPAPLNEGDDDTRLYKVSLEVKDGNKVLQRAETEIVAGEIKPYYSIDYAKVNAVDAGWQNVAPVGPEAYGQSPPEVAFRQDGDRFIWGVTQQQYIVQGLTYCTVIQVSCDSDSLYEPAFGIDTMYGLQGVAEGPLVDLGKVINEAATLSLRHGHVLEGRDGAIVEVMPVRSPVSKLAPQPAFFCTNEESGDAVPLWFQLHPAEGSTLHVDATGQPSMEVRVVNNSPQPNAAATTAKNTAYRVNPVDLEGDGLLIGGPGVDRETTRFSLEAPLMTACPPGFEEPSADELPSSVINYTVQLRLRTGTTPGLNVPECTQRNNDCRGEGETRNPPTRAGAMGWQVDAIGVSSFDVQLLPEEGRILPLSDGLAKRFNIQVSNQGPLPETFLIGLADPERSGVDPTWIRFLSPEVELDPGETRTVPFDVLVPADLRADRGTYTTYIRAASRLDPTAFDDMRVDLVLAQNPLPDLATELDIQTDTDFIEPGKVSRIITTVHNIGQESATSVPIDILVTRLNDTGHDIETVKIATKQLPDLGMDEVAVEISEWVPRQAGTYRIDAIADPERKLIQKSVENSRIEKFVNVLPPDRAEVKIQSLEFKGVGSDGYALEGELVIIEATLKNEGLVTATGGRLILTAGSTELADVEVGALSPGETRTVTALRVASPGESKIRALYLPGNGQEDPHELSRILRVRGLDLSYETVQQPIGLSPGDIVTTQINVTNDGNAVEKVLFTLDGSHEGWNIAATPNPVTLAPDGGMGWSILTLQPPPDALAGEYDLLLLATPQSHPDARQHVAVPVSVTSQIEAPMMEVDNATGPPGALEIPMTIESHSNAPQDVQVVTDPAAWMDTPYNLTLQPGRSTSIGLPVQVPKHTLPGNASFTVMVRDLQNQTLVAQEATVQVLAQEAGSAAWSANHSNERRDGLLARVLSIDLEFTNEGNVPARPYVVMSELTPGVETVPKEGPGVVQPGDTVHVPVAIRVGEESLHLIAGRATVFIEVADHEANTFRDILVTEVQLPDLGQLPDVALTAVSVAPRGIIDVGKPLRMDVTLENPGRTKAPATQLYAYVNGELVNAYDVPAIPEGETTQVNITWEFQESGEYLIHLVADGNDRILELHEDNNGWIQELQVEPGSALQQAKEAPAPPIPLLLIALALAIRRIRRQM